MEGVKGLTMMTIGKAHRHTHVCMCVCMHTHTHVHVQWTYRHTMYIEVYRRRNAACHYHMVLHGKMHTWHMVLDNPDTEQLLNTGIRL